MKIWTKNLNEQENREWHFAFKSKSQSSLFMFWNLDIHKGHVVYGRVILSSHRFFSDCRSILYMTWFRCKRKIHEWVVNDNWCPRGPLSEVYRSKLISKAKRFCRTKNKTLQ